MGLMGRPSLAPDAALWLPDSNGIHMMFMRFPIDAVFVGRPDPSHDGARPVRVRPPGAAGLAGLVPLVRGAHGVLELPVGTIAESGTAVGDLIALEPLAGGSAASQPALARGSRSVARYRRGAWHVAHDLSSADDVGPLRRQRATAPDTRASATERGAPGARSSAARSHACPRDIGDTNQIAGDRTRGAASQARTSRDRAETPRERRGVPRDDRPVGGRPGDDEQHRDVRRSPAERLRDRSRDDPDLLRQATSAWPAGRSASTSPR